MSSEFSELLTRAADGHSRAQTVLVNSSDHPTIPSAPERTSTGPPGDELRALEKKLVWILGSPRSGSSWLMRMLLTFQGVEAINEPYVGVHLVPLGEADADGEYWSTGPRADDPNYLFARRHLPALMPQLRRLVLDGLRLGIDRRPTDPPVSRVVVKEPNGSHASDTIVMLLPGSRLLFLLRDGRDVVDSLADALRSEGSWWATSRAGGRADRDGSLEFISRHSEAWVLRTNATERAFARMDPDRRLLVRYEQLLADPERELVRIVEWSGIEADRSSIERAVEAHRFAAVPAEQRGPGKAIRRARPGGWRERFNPEEIALMEEIMGDKLTQLGYELG